MNAREKAEAAIRLKENADFKAIISLIEADIFEAFRTTKIGDAEVLQNVHALSHAFTLLNNKIDKYIEIGIFEAQQDKNSEIF